MFPIGIKSPFSSATDNADKSSSVLIASENSTSIDELSSDTTADFIVIPPLSYSDTLKLFRYTSLSAAEVALSEKPFMPPENPTPDFAPMYSPST